MKVIIYILTLLIVCSASYFIIYDNQNLQGFSDSTKEWIKLVESERDFDGSRFKIKSISKEKHKELANGITLDDYYRLTDYPNPKIRLFAYTRLCYKKLDNKMEVIKKAIRDTSLINYQTGCINRFERLNFYLINDALTIPTDGFPVPPFNGSKESFGLSPQQIEEIKAYYKIHGSTRL